MSNRLFILDRKRGYYNVERLLLMKWLLFFSLLCRRDLVVLEHLFVSIDCMCFIVSFNNMTWRCLFVISIAWSQWQRWQLTATGPCDMVISYWSLHWTNGGASSSQSYRSVALPIDIRKFRNYYDFKIEQRSIHYEILDNEKWKNNNYQNVYVRVNYIKLHICISKQYWIT